MVIAIRVMTVPENYAVKLLVIEPFDRSVQCASEKTVAVEYSEFSAQLYYRIVLPKAFISGGSEFPDTAVTRNIA